VTGWEPRSAAARESATADRRERRRRRVLVAAAVTPAIALAALAGATLFWGEPQAARIAGGGAGSSLTAPFGPRPADEQVRNPAPRTVTLTAADLPPGYHVLRQSPAGFIQGGAGSAPASWDVVFAPDGAPVSGTQLVESMVIVYPSVAAANAALDAQDTADQAARAVPRRPGAGLGDRATEWIEPASERGTEIVRVTWRSLNVVAQVSALGPIGVIDPGRVDLLAAVQQDRIASPSPTGAS
jgi:hypothetical protein